jgi:hypothetical protein
VVAQYIMTPRRILVIIAIKGGRPETTVEKMNVVKEENRDHIIA